MINRHNIPVSELNSVERTLLHPDFWGGHTIGHGDIQAVPDITAPPRLMREASGSLTLAQELAGTFALQTFRPGDTFDANDHPTGTIIQADGQELQANLPFEPLDLSALGAYAPHPQLRLFAG